MKRRLMFAGVLLFVMASIWFINEKEQSFKNPVDAIHELDGAVQVIPAHVTEQVAYYFFMKNEKDFGFVAATKHLFGWKAKTIRYVPIANQNFTDRNSIPYDDTITFGIVNETGKNTLPKHAIIQLIDGEAGKQLKKAGHSTMYGWYLTKS
ncbi:hypothetical protein [Lysinibacillus alkalisoli]|nr:hypothetical protein [Lysinibacillus alkalisoli]